ncbi:MAG: hypothetical protein ABSB42_10810 [Tepidisphaeraceae bacterium]|jgi:hypothetical protein
MAMWIVEGVVRETGNDIKTWIEAETQDEAAKAANSKGILVSSVTERDPLTELAVPAASMQEFEAEETKRKVSRIKSDSHALIPEYENIVTDSKAVKVVSLILLFVGIVTVVGGIIALASGEALGGLAIAAGISWMILAPILGLFSSLAMAIRDIARNSFTKVK